MTGLYGRCAASAPYTFAAQTVISPNICSSQQNKASRMGEQRRQVGTRVQEGMRCDCGVGRWIVRCMAREVGWGCGGPKADLGVL